VVRVTTARQLMKEDRKVEATELRNEVPTETTELRNEACTEAENKSDIEGSHWHGGGIKGGIDVFGETWTSISSHHAMSSRIWTLLCPPSDAAHMAAVADCDERNNQVPSAVTDLHDLNQCRSHVCWQIRRQGRLRHYCDDEES